MTNQLKRVSVLMATAFVDMIGFSIVFPLVPFYATRLGADEWVVGPLIAAFAVAQLMSAPYWGRLSDRYGRRPAILLGLLTGTIAFTVFGLASSLWLLFLARIIQGVGGGTTGVLQAYIADATESSQRARALGWLSAATSAGVMVGPAIGSLAFRFGYAAPGLLAAGLCLLNIVFAWRWLPEAASREEPAATEPQRSIRSQVLHVVLHPHEDICRLILIYTFAMGAFTALTAVMPLFLAVRFGVSETTIGYFFVYVGGLSVVMRALVIGWLVDRLGEHTVLRLGAVVLVLGFGLMPLATGIPTFLLFVSGIPIGTALLFPATSALVSHRAKPGHVGTTLSVQQAFGGISRVVGPIWGAAAFEWLGAPVPFYASALILLFVFVLASRALGQVSVPEPAVASAAE